MDKLNLKNIKSMDLFDKFKKNKIEIKPFGKITKEDIREIEELFDVVLPNDYKKFLLKYNGGAVKLNEFNKLFLDDANETVSIDVLYGIHTDKKASDIEYWTNEYAEDLLEKTIIIGDSIQHGFIVLVCDGSNNGIYYYDDSYYFDSSNEENNVYFIADSFEEFWEILVG